MKTGSHPETTLSSLISKAALCFAQRSNGKQQRRKGTFPARTVTGLSNGINSI